MTKNVFLLPMTQREKIVVIADMKISNMTESHDELGMLPKETSMLIENLPCLPAMLARLAFKSTTYEISDRLPAIKSQLNDFVINPRHLAAYRQHCGFKPGSKIPATYLQVAAFPLILNIMSHNKFPLRALGKVHIANQVSCLEAFDPRQPINLTAEIGSSLLTSRGLEWNIDFTATVDNQLVWSGFSTYMHQCETGIGRREKPKVIRGDNPEDWLVPKKIGRTYGRLSGDCNPIHISNWTAKMFGFKQAIAHGMWSKARCLAALEDILPGPGYTVDTTFHRPIFLPSEVKFYTRKIKTGKYFSLFNQAGEKAYLKGLIS